MKNQTELLQRCRKLINDASGILITAGAGMGVDSGMPDFRGNEGLWKAYPALAKAGLNFRNIATPSTFYSDPALAWGFYGHRLNMYRELSPHDGFSLLREIAEAKPDGYFVVTSNVDGHFQKAGFASNRIWEVHGTIHHLQCSIPCGDSLYSAANFKPIVDESTCILNSPFPECPNCHNVLRPNILMFGDMNWLGSRSDLQQAALTAWETRVKKPVVLEFGAGTSIPTIRYVSETFGAPVIRVNLREPEVPKETDIGLAMGALAFMQAIADSKERKR